jgi:hypothetical protein
MLAQAWRKVKVNGHVDAVKRTLKRPYNKNYLNESDLNLTVVGTSEGSFTEPIAVGFACAEFTSNVTSPLKVGHKELAIPVRPPLAFRTLTTRFLNSMSFGVMLITSLTRTPVRHINRSSK